MSGAFLLPPYPILFSCRTEKYVDYNTAKKVSTVLPDLKCKKPSMVVICVRQTRGTFANTQFGNLQNATETMQKGLKTSLHYYTSHFAP